MAETPPAPPPVRSPWRRFADGLTGSVVFVAFYFWLSGLLVDVPLVGQFPRAIRVVQVGGAGFIAIVMLVGLWQVYQEALAQNRSARVSKAIDSIASQPGKDVAGISVADVAEQLGGRPEDAERLTRLVEQQKQQRLIDEQSFQQELDRLIVEYLQPLPRNAKRVLNRFRVNLLIAHARGLLTGGAGVTAQQIGKWMVLSERWPQLARPLSANPERMAELERQAVLPVPAPDVNPVQTSEGRTSGNDGRGRKKQNAPLDPFMASIRQLAPYYVGDEDLRRFICSKPELRGVLKHLVHYRYEAPDPVPGTQPA